MDERAAGEILLDENELAEGHPGFSLGGLEVQTLPFLPSFKPLSSAGGLEVQTQPFCVTVMVPSLVGDLKDLKPILCRADKRLPQSWQYISERGWSIFPHCADFSRPQETGVYCGPHRRGAVRSVCQGGRHRQSDSAGQTRHHLWQHGVGPGQQHALLSDSGTVVRIRTPHTSCSLPHRHV